MLLRTVCGKLKEKFQAVVVILSRVSKVANEMDAAEAFKLIKQAGEYSP